MELKLSIEEYLKPTEYCDYNHPEITAQVKELGINDKTPKEMALNIFYFVRDQIKFMMVSGNDKASDTLIKRYGDCGTKTNLQVALLRATNIPSRYHVASLHKECIKGIVSKLFYTLSPKIIPHHPWCECYLNRRWISYDTVFDKELTEAVYKKSIHTREDIPTIDWDGEKDLNPMNKWMVRDRGTYPSLDILFLEIQKEFEKIPIEAMIHSKKFTDRVRKL